MKALTVTLGAALLIGSVATGAQAAIEQPKYTVIERLQDDIEIRRYTPRTVAEVEIPMTGERSARRQAFRILAGYIFGKNLGKTKIAMTAPVETQQVQTQQVQTRQTGKKIAMTAPVETQAVGGKFRMAFFLPAQFTVKTAPKPLDPRIKLRTAPAVTKAAYRFSGAPGAADMKLRWGVLRDKLANSKWRATSKPVSFFYNPPWTLPFMRRNEVAVTVTAR